jgi:hypothetical protein
VSPLIVRGADELAAKTDRIAGRLESPTGAEPTLSDILRGRIERRFQAQGEGDWAPHAPATDERWGSHQLLRLTGALQAALAGASGRVEGTTIRYAPDAPGYAAIVNGRRPIMPEGDTALADELAAALAEHVMEP